MFILNLVGSLTFDLIYHFRPSARGIRQNIILSDDISLRAIITPGNIPPNPLSRGSTVHSTN
jgi:hypothetical protein